MGQTTHAATLETHLCAVVQDACHGKGSNKVDGDMRVVEVAGRRPRLRSTGRAHHRICLFVARTR